jgi:hypothetical protein
MPRDKWVFLQKAVAGTFPSDTAHDGSGVESAPGRRKTPAWSVVSEITGQIRGMVRQLHRAYRTTSVLTGFPSAISHRKRHNVARRTQISLTASGSGRWLPSDSGAILGAPTLGSRCQMRFPTPGRSAYRHTGMSWSQSRKFRHGTAACGKTVSELGHQTRFLPRRHGVQSDLATRPCVPEAPPDPKIPTGPSAAVLGPVK